MGDLPQYFDIILFAMVAAFLILRLRSVLGRRTGHEKRPDSFVRPTDPRPAERVGDKTGNNVIPLGARGPATQPPLPTTTPADAVAAGIERLRSVDPGFEPAAFLEGARTAFEMIVAAFAAGDRIRLRPLLSDEVYKPFSDAIDEREAASETLETRILNLKSIDIAEVALAGRIARVTVKFVSDQINVLRAHDGSIVDGHPDEPAEKTDFWTFARDTRSSDPNWVLVTTASG
jgi:predicted lipid-binding transport protein (Tim44 family)